MPTEARSHRMLRAPWRAARTSHLLGRPGGEALAEPIRFPTAPQTDPRLRGLLARLPRHAHGLPEPAPHAPDARPTPGALDHPADGGEQGPDGPAQALVDIAQWRVLGDVGVAALIEVALQRVPVRPRRARRLPSPAVEDAAPRRRYRPKRFTVPGPLRLQWRVQVYPRLAGAGAIHVLAALHAPAAAAPLLPLFAGRVANDHDYLWAEALAAYYANLGAPALPLLRGRVADRGLHPRGRHGAILGLGHLAQAHPHLYAGCVDALCFPLRPEYVQQPRDEMVAAFAVALLVDLRAVVALPLIEAACARDAVDPWAWDLDAAVALLAPGWAPRYQAQPDSLPLSCDACGRLRSHRVHAYTIGRNLTAVARQGLADPHEREVANRYGPILIAHPVRCPHCGAVNRYRASALTVMYALETIEAITEGRPSPHPRAWITEVTTHVGPVHPAVAAVRYRRALDADPVNHLARLRLANSLRNSGQWEEAALEGRSLILAEGVGPEIRAEAAYHLALLSAAEGRPAEAATWCEVGLGRRTKAEPSDASAHAGAAINGRGLRPHLAIQLRRMHAVVTDPRIYDAAWFFDRVSGGSDDVISGPERTTKVGRNDPCPCGSGKKYKRCCGA